MKAAEEAKAKAQQGSGGGDDLGNGFSEVNHSSGSFSERKERVNERNAEKEAAEERARKFQEQVERLQSELKVKLKSLDKAESDAFRKSMWKGVLNATRATLRFRNVFLHGMWHYGPTLREGECVTLSMTQYFCVVR